MTENNQQIDVVRRYLKHPSPHIRSRANIVLQTLDGKDEESIANETEVSLRTVRRWQAAWAEQGLAIFPDDAPASKPEPARAQVENVVSEQQTKHKAEPEKKIAATPEPATEKIVAQPEPEIAKAASTSEPSSAEVDDKSLIQPDDTLAEAGRKIMLEQLEHLIEHETGVLNKDVEAVHQMRIATRRWRSIYKGFASYLPGAYTKKMRKYVRQTAQYLGRIRDLDVFLEKTQQYIKANPDAPELEPLISLVKKDRRKARKQMRQWLSDKEYAKFVKRAHRKLQKSKSKKKPKTQLDRVLPDLITERFEAVRAYDDVIDKAPIEVLHNLRVECKRLRYTLEAFADVLGDEVQVVVDATKVLQDHLGDMNDAEIAVEKIRAYEKRVKKSKRGRLKAYRKNRKGEMKHLRSTFPTVWSQFNRDEIQQALTTSIAAL